MNSQANPLLQKSTLRHGAFPFDQLKIEHFEPALVESLKEARANIERLRLSTEKPTFTNTILALETASEAMGRVTGVFYNLLHANTSDELQALAQKFGPMLATFSSDVSLDPKIFERVKAVWAERPSLKEEDYRLTEKTFKDFAKC
jgi:peptidyl-dipeptidase Dcp